MNNTPAQGTPPTEIFQAPPPAGNVPPATGTPVTLPPALGIGEMPLPPQTPIPPQPPGLDIKKIAIIGGGILVLLIVIFFVYRLFAGSTSTNEEGNATLEYWGLYEDPQVMKVLINDFEREHKNIKVNFTEMAPDKYREKLVTRIKNGNGPDIFRYHNSWVPMLTGVLLPLSTDAVTPSDYEKSYYKVIRTDLVLNGGILGIPLGIDTLALFTNDQMFSSQGLKPPENWDQFVQTAASLTTRAEDGDNKGQITTAGTALGTVDNVTHASDIISLFLVQNGVDLYDVTKATNPKSEDACKLLACGALSFYTFFATGDGEAKSVWDGRLDRSVVAFANGKVGMYFGYSWDIYTIKGINPELAFSIHPVPNLGQSQKKTIASYWVEGVSNQTKFPKASMEFMKYLNKKETQQLFFTENAKIRKLGSPYARIDLAASLKDEPLLYPFVLQAPYAVSTPFVQDTQDNGLNATLNGYLKNTVNEISGNTSPETAVGTLNQGIIQAFGQYVRK